MTENNHEISSANVSTDALICASMIYIAYLRYNKNFQLITRRAYDRFISRDWNGAQEDRVERLGLWEKSVERSVNEIHKNFGKLASDHIFWQSVKAEYGRRIHSYSDAELAQTFFTSVSRRSFNTIGVDPLIEFGLELQTEAADPDVIDSAIYINWADLPDTINRILSYHAFKVDYADKENSRDFIVAEIRHLLPLFGFSENEIIRIELSHTPFFQSVRAFLVGRIQGLDWTIPFAIGFRNSKQGVFSEAVIIGQDDFAVLFGFTRSYFFVDLETVRSAINFLRTLLPDKPLDELYSVLGRIRQGKTERYRALAMHIKPEQSKFVHAEGDKGLVMIVFTLPEYHLVFKVLRDKFGLTKSITHRQVIEKYRFITRYDRVGRLIDTQAFRNIEFPVRLFADELLRELTNQAKNSVRISGDKLVIDLVYMERKLHPLNLFLKTANDTDAENAIIDYGQSIKDLAYTNIFPGDMLLKNFGVTRHGRIIFYDFDEIVLLESCNFRVLPTARDDEDLMSNDIWFNVQPNDVFPQQFENFLGLNQAHKSIFMSHHSDLLDPVYWRNVQSAIASRGAGALKPLVRAPFPHHTVMANSF